MQFRAYPRPESPSGKVGFVVLDPFLFPTRLSNQCRIGKIITMLSSCQVKYIVMLVVVNQINKFWPSCMQEKGTNVVVVLVMVATDTSTAQAHRACWRSSA